jgi:hypothetical protein
MNVNKVISLELGWGTKSLLTFNALVTASKGKGEGRVKCTVSKHRIAKTAILVGTQMLLRMPPATVLELVEKWAYISNLKPRVYRKRMVRLVLACASPPGLLEGLDRVLKHISGAVSHRRVTKTALCIGLDSLSRVEPGKLRLLVSKICPVPRKYWDPELGLWL